MPRILILSYSNVNSDPRVLRQIKFFKENGFEIFLCARAYTGNLPFFQLTKPKNIIFRIIKLGIMIFKLKKLRVLEFLYHTELDKLIKINPGFDFIIANDVETWPVAVELRRYQSNVKLIFDAHEHYAKQFSDRRIWRWFHEGFSKYLCEKYIPEANEFLTVCEGIAQDYEAEYKVKPTVVLNTPEFQSDLKPNPIGHEIQIIHHGIANRSRKIEKMIKMMDYLDDRFFLNLILMPVDPSYLLELKKMAEGKRIEFIEPVPTQEIPKFINQFDIGLFILEPVNFNYANALPNKFFEFIQARLAIAIGPTPEMKKIVDKEKIGIVTETFDEWEMANKLNKITQEEIFQFKMKTEAIAEKYSNKQNELIFLELTKKYAL